tara:strand:+ start:4906 stop:8805 length:3900 start_codon:yes stop_codon:yes gene_type:complete
MDKIVRKISRGNLLGDKLNMISPTINPEPLHLNNINAYQCTQTDMTFDICETTILDPLFPLMQDMDAGIIQGYFNFISKVFIDNFERGTFNWESISSEFSMELRWNTIFPWIQTLGDNSMRIVITDPVQDSGWIYTKTNTRKVLQNGFNYRISLKLTTDVQFIKDCIATNTTAQAVIITAYNPVSNLSVDLVWNSIELMVFPDREVISDVFTAPDGGDYEFIIQTYAGLSVLGNVAQIMDFWIIDDFIVSLETSTSSENSFTTVKREIFGFFKSFNIEATEYNLRLYNNEITNYLKIQPLDVDELGLGVYGDQGIDPDSGLQTGIYTVTSPPEGVIPFYYLSYNLYGALVTNVQGTTTTNDGFLYCQAPDLDIWATSTIYSLGDVVEDNNGKLWYCVDDPVDSCNACEPGIINCGWVACLNILSYKTRNVNVNFPLFQDIKDIGIYTDLIYPGITEECSGSIETLTKDYKCPVPYYVSDGGEVIFYDNQTTSEVKVDRHCCEDYSEYGFVWYREKCYKDYGRTGVGIGAELFNFTYPTLFIGRGDNQLLFNDGAFQLQGEIQLDTSSSGQILNDAGQRTLIYTPLISNLVDGETYIFKADLLMQFYDNSALSVIKLGASGQLDANWGYVWYQNFDLGTSLISLPPVEGPPCIGGSTTHDIQNGILYSISTNCNSSNTNVIVSMDQGMEYRIRFGYIGLTNTSSPIAITNQLSNNDMTFSVMDITNSVVMFQDYFGGPGFYDKEYLFTPSFSGLFELQISAINPMPPGNGPFGDYGYGLDYWALDERPFNYTEEDNVSIDSTKTWASNSGDPADGSLWTELESTITLTNATHLSLRLVCDVKEPINANPLALGLVISGMSLTRYTVPNFLGCKPTHFLNDVSKRLTLTGVTMVSQTTPIVSNTLVGLEMSQGEEIVETSVPYVTTVENTDPRIIPAYGSDTSALCEPSQLIVGWECVPDYPFMSSGVIVLDGNNDPLPLVGGGACVAVSSITPGITLYATAQQCHDYTTCNWEVGCTDPIAFNYNSTATTPCVDQTLPGYPLTGAHLIDGDCCILPIIGCMNPSSIQYNPFATAESGQVMVYFNPSTGLMEQIFNQYGIWGTCEYQSGCPDPTASNYADPMDPDNCLPSVGANGNVLSCTDCLGNPPSSLYGNPLYPSAILPGTMGNQSCCEFQASGSYLPELDDVAAGCTDPSAINFNENCQGVNVGTALVDDGCCTYNQTWTVWCCDQNLWNGSFVCCMDITVATQVAYQGLIDSGDCFDDKGDCDGTNGIGYTFCSGFGPVYDAVTCPLCIGNGSCP